MAYREKVFNANVLTDLLSTYLTHRAGEREKYYKAEQQARQANKPIVRTVGNNIVEIDPATKQAKVLYKGPKKESKKTFIEVETPDGMVLKEKQEGMITKLPKKIDNQKISSFRKEVMDAASTNIKRLNKLKEPKQNPLSGAIISEEEQKKFYGENEKNEMNYWKSIRKNAKKYADEFVESGILPVYEQGVSELYVPNQLKKQDKTTIIPDSFGQEKKLDSPVAPKNKKEINSKLLQDLKNEFPALGESNNPPTEKDARYYFSKKGKSDFKKMVEEYEQKYPPGTYDPLAIDIERSRFWFDLEQKYLPKNLDSRLGSKYLMQYNFDIADKFGRNKNLDEPATPKAKKGSFWE